MKIQSLAGNWEFRQKGQQEWLPAEVPGGVHTDLLALGRIPEPFEGDNEKRIQWVAESDWEYHRQFTVESELMQQSHIWLICDGLDTLATVSLNGVKLGNTRNMFRQYRWDVKALLNAGENDLHVAFDSPVRFAATHQNLRLMPGVSQAIPGGPYLRKAPCQFGWDWGPQLPPIGIWKDIRLEGYAGARIEEVHLRQYHAEDKVTVEARIIIQNWDEVPCLASVHIIAPDGKIFESNGTITGEKVCTLQVEVLNPQLWWPNGYGSQPLYRVSIELHQSSLLLDQREYQLGLRTIELRQQPDEWGRSFTFVVNGQPIFAKGSNWIPADSFPTRISGANLEKLIHAAADTHQNMLRVWGGGFYEDERFYDLCDRFGILVWQEFIFSCSVYPLDDAEFVENIRVEVVENIRRLRHRASLALWCGNNEMEWGWVDWGWKAPEYQDMKVAY
ncbi:MAG: glycoside hydrolase family 2 protein, partial [Anaerolineaceae bacterium]